MKAASGGPGVEYSLLVMLELALQGIVSLPQVVQLMCQNPAVLFGIEKRGFIRPGYKADLVVVNPKIATLAGEHVYSKCGWTPYEGVRFSHSIDTTYVNGRVAFRSGEFPERAAEPLRFNQSDRR